VSHAEPNAMGRCLINYKCQLSNVASVSCRRLTELEDILHRHLSQFSEIVSA
jgi:hypothetical protein